MKMIQNASDLKLRGTGTDGDGSFAIDGAVTLPSRINFTKIYKKSGKITVFEGEIKLGSDPLYLSGQWKLKDVAGKSKEKAEAVFGSSGSWQANFYPASH